MSYCRFSSDNFTSDFYIYESDQGFEVHVAWSRHVCPEPLPALPVIEDTPECREEWLVTNEVRRRLLDEAVLEPIDLPYAGTSHTFDSGVEAARFVTMLVDLGFNVPGNVVMALTNSDVTPT